MGAVACCARLGIRRLVAGTFTSSFALSLSLSHIIGHGAHALAPSPQGTLPYAQAAKNLTAGLVVPPAKK